MISEKKMSDTVWYISFVININDVKSKLFAVLSKLAIKWSDHYKMIYQLKITKTYMIDNKLLKKKTLSTYL